MIFSLNKRGHRSCGLCHGPYFIHDPFVDNIYLCITLEGVEEKSQLDLSGDAFSFVIN